MAKQQKEKETHIWQHCVPESYLKRFVDKNGLLYVFDKTTEKTRQDKPSNVAAAKHFYTYPEDAFPEDIRDSVDRKAIEFAFSDHIEPRFQTAVQEVLDFAKQAILPGHLHEPLVFYLIVQLLRTQSYRESVRQLMQKQIEGYAYL